MIVSCKYFKKYRLEQIPVLNNNAKIKLNFLELLKILSDVKARKVFKLHSISFLIITSLNKDSNVDLSQCDMSAVW